MEVASPALRELLVALVASSEAALVQCSTVECEPLSNIEKCRLGGGRMIEAFKVDWRVANYVSQTLLYACCYLVTACYEAVKG